MKKVFLILCLMAFSACAYAEANENLSTEKNENNYIEYTQEQSSQNVEQEVPQTKQNSKTEKKVRYGSTRSNSSNSYYNFGGTSGFKGRF